MTKSLWYLFFWDYQYFTLADLKMCLNVGATGLRDSLLKDRVRSNLNLVSEDVEFLNDQLGPSLKAMSHKPDTQFNDRKAANLKRKYGSLYSVITWSVHIN